MSLDVFPADFKWGVAIASYQSEGAWDEDGKGESIWDRYTHEDPSRIVDGSNGDVACDAYHKIDDDIEMLKFLGVNHYRFSIAWTRIFPNGKSSEVNEKGVEHYNKLIDTLLANNIEPFVTLYHWDLPQALHEEFGGWLSEDIIDSFGDYARFCFERFGDRVKNWLTINEINLVSRFSYGVGIFAPGGKNIFVDDYITANNMLKAHATAYHIYDTEFRSKQNGRVSLSYCLQWYGPGTSSADDKAAADRANEILNTWLIHPIFSDTGDYSPWLKDWVARRSEAENRTESRLPTLSDDWIAKIKGSADFIAIQYYNSRLVKDGSPPEDNGDVNGKEGDFTSYLDPSWTLTSSSPMFGMSPMGLRRGLNWIKEKYGNPEVIITETGSPDDDGKLEDQSRVLWLKSYLAEALNAIKDGCKLTGIMIWSLMDNYEWASGYTIKFGLFRVDFDDPARTRTAKKSASAIKDIISTGKVILDAGELAELAKVAPLP